MRKKFVLLITLIVIMLTKIPTYAASTDISYIPACASINVNSSIIDMEREPVIINGRVLVPARTVFKNLGAAVHWYPDTDIVRIVKDSISISMKIGERNVKANDIYKKMDVPPILIRGTVMVPIRFVAEILKSEVRWNNSNRTVYIGKNINFSGISRANGRQYVVVIDAGHGGMDPGAVYGGVKEKDLNFDIAKRLNSLLKANNIKVYMTRTDDYYVSLYSRSNLANRVNADLFISIHNNAGYSRYSGSSSLYFPSYWNVNRKLSGRTFAAIVQSELTSTLQSKNIGIIPRPRLSVLRNTKMPAVIAEIGFMTNWSEMQKLKSSSYRQKAAEALMNAIIKTLGRM